MARHDAQKMVELYNSGMTPTQVSKAIGCSVSNVRHALVTRGVHKLHENRIDWPIEEMRKWYEIDGMTVAEIGAKLGQNSKVVNKVCKKNGFRMRPRGQKFGDQHKGWKGGRTIDKSGYVLVYCPDHPNRNTSGYIREHRLVMERKLGRLLERHEVVHHIDGVKDNNDPSNLGLFHSNGKHLAETLAGKCPNWTPEGKKRLLEAAKKAGRHSAIRRKQARDAAQSP